MLDRARRVPWLNRMLTRGVRAVGRESRVVRRFGRRHLPPIGPVVQTLPNGRRLVLWTEGDDFAIANGVFWRGWAGYEPETSPLFFHLAKEARCVVDVGANVGYYTLLAALANPRGTVLAFEPLPANERRLRRNLHASRVENVRVLPVALSDQEGQADFYVPRAGALSVRSALADPAGDAVHPAELWDRTPVTTRVFDDVARASGLAEVDLVKIDVEGAEVRVLRGMSETLARSRPALVVELLTASAALEVWRLLEPLGYRFFRLTRDGPEPVRDPPERVFDWRNFLLIPEVSRLWAPFARWRTPGPDSTRRSSAETAPVLPSP